MGIIFVCTGNTCRSPLAESYAKTKFKNYTFSSRGIAVTSMSVSTYTQSIISSKGLAEATLPKMLNETDILNNKLLVMTHHHKEIIKSTFKDADVELISVFSGLDYNDVTDPFGGDFKDYTHVYNQLKRYIDAFQL